MRKCIYSDQANSVQVLQDGCGLVFVAAGNGIPLPVESVESLAKILQAWVSRSKARTKSRELARRILG